MTGDALTKAERAADAKGMSLRQIPERPDLCEVFCRRCGWGRGWRDVSIEKFAAAPHGCAACGHGGKA